MPNDGAHRYIWSRGGRPLHHRRKTRTFEQHPRIRERIEDGKSEINRYGKRDINARRFHHTNTICLAFKSLHKRTSSPPSRIDRITRRCISSNMISRVRSYFKEAKLARMSDGTLCLIRDLGLVKGGKGMRHHETLVTFTGRGLFASVRAFGAAWPTREPELRADTAKQL